LLPEEIGLDDYETLLPNVEQGEICHHDTEALPADIRCTGGVGNGNDRWPLVGYCRDGDVRRET
jgi:hypothetical protein